MADGDREIRRLEDAQRALALYRSRPNYAAAERVGNVVAELIRSEVTPPEAL